MIFHDISEELTRQRSQNSEDVEKRVRDHTNMHSHFHIQNLHIIILPAMIYCKWLQSLSMTKFLESNEDY